jgi:L-alanine-DL-glutamate epimerase-like enolase superfamily enzyme
VNSSFPSVRSLRATPVNVPLARPHPTASGVVESAPLVLLDLETDQGLVGHSYVFCYTSIAEHFRRINCQEARYSVASCSSRSRSYIEVTYSGL